MMIDNLVHKGADYFSWPAMGEFYKLVSKIGDTTKDKRGIRGFFDEWYTTSFNHKDINVKIHEWANGMAMDSFLDSMHITDSGLLVYKADVHRYDSSFHKIKVLGKNPDWLEKIQKISSSYF